MNWDNFLNTAAARPFVDGEIEQFCSEHQITLEDFCDTLCFKIAVGYSEGSFVFAYCDGVVNHLYSYMVLTYGTTLPEFSWSVFSAFDDGEYLHETDDGSVSSEEKYTRPQIVALLAKRKTTHSR